MTTIVEDPKLLGHIGWDGSTATSERVQLRASVVNRKHVERNHYVRIEGMPKEEGDVLFQRLHDWIGRDEFVYAHRWRVGDVVFWDNTSVVHRRDAFPPTQRRFLKRTGFHLPEELAVPF